MNRRQFTRVVLPVIALAPVGCGSPTSPRVFADSLTLGTGKRGIDLVGGTTVFGGELVTVYWRIESAERLDWADVEFAVDRSTGGGYEEEYSTIYSPTDRIDHVVISSYYHIYGAGKFRARGFVPRTGKTFGPVEFNVVKTP